MIYVALTWRMNFFNLPDGAVTTDVDLHDIRVNHVITLAIEVVFETLNTALIPWDDGRRKHNRVGLLELDETMVVSDDARERGVLLSLSAGTDDYDLVVRILVDVVDRDKRFLFYLDVAEFLGYFDVHLHAVALKRHALPLLFGVFDEVGNTAYLGRKGPDDDRPGPS
jgi:hypothetical protein